MKKLNPEKLKISIKIMWENMAGASTGTCTYVRLGSHCDLVDGVTVVDGQIWGPPSDFYDSKKVREIDRCDKNVLNPKK